MAVSVIGVCKICDSGRPLVAVWIRKEEPLGGGDDGKLSEVEAGCTALS